MEESTGEPGSERPELKLEGRTWELPSDTKVQKQVRDELERRLVDAGWAENDITNILLGADEAVANAIVHGNLGIGGEQTYADHAAFREAVGAAMKTELGKRQAHLTVDIETDLVRLSVADEGAGFDIEKLPDPRDEDMLLQQGGRGVFLMRSAFDIVGYNKAGNTVWLEKRREPTT